MHARRRRRSLPPQACQAACRRRHPTLMAGSEIVVVGAGVIGLSTAVCLAERGHDVQVLSDLQPVRTTSAVASAIIGPLAAPSGSPLAAWGHASVEKFTALAREPDTGGTRASIGSSWRPRSSRNGPHTGPGVLHKPRLICSWLTPPMSRPGEALGRDRAQMNPRDSPTTGSAVAREPRRNHRPG
ncbi:MAG: FAD-dependent oxidoreductase [Solirubrobacteraceae bacterium]